MLESASLPIPFMQKAHLPSRSVLVRNLLANWSGLVAEVLVAFFLTPFIISHLGTAAYGVWSLANGVIAVDSTAMAPGRRQRRLLSGFVGKSSPRHGAGTGDRP